MSHLPGSNVRSDLERRVSFTAAYDKRDPDPLKDYGIHGVDLRFLLGNDEGWVQFLLFTGWMLPEPLGLGATPDRYGFGGFGYSEALVKHGGRIAGPMPADLGYHSPRPLCEGQEPYDCDLLPGGKCYYDGSGLNAVAPFYALLHGGDAGVWEYLEHYHADTFEREAVA